MISKLETGLWAPVRGKYSFPMSPADVSPLRASSTASANCTIASDQTGLAAVSGKGIGVPWITMVGIFQKWQKMWLRSRAFTT